jgi:hypothetical protein
MRILCYVLINGIQLHEAVAPELVRLTDDELIKEVTKIIFSGPKSTAANPVAIPAFTIKDLGTERPTLIMSHQLAFVQVARADLAPPEDELAARRDTDTPDPRESWREN